MKANIKKGKRYEVDWPAQTHKEFEDENGNVVAKIERSKAGISRLSKKFKKMANRRVRYENFIDEENKGKTEKEMLLEELESGIKEIFETAVEEFKSFVDEIAKRIPENVELTPEELEKTCRKATNEGFKGLKGFSPVEGYGLSQ